MFSAAPGGDAAVFLALIGRVEPPYKVLYVLHTPRGEGEPGRYEIARNATSWLAS